MSTKSQCTGAAVGMSHEYATVKKCVFSLAQKVVSELALRMSFGGEFQTFGAATQNAHLAVSVRVHGTEKRGASADRRDRVVTGVVEVRQCTAERKSSEPCA